MTGRNPLTNLDYPDPDVIRVDDTYYMATTTMHFMPGCEILRSYDLLNWEHAAYVYDRLDSTPGQRLEGEENCYGKGMWAACLRYHKGLFYVCFVANDTHKTYLYTSPSIRGPWKKQLIEGFYHDCSLLFDNDQVYIAYGNKEIWVTQLRPDLSGPLEGGLHRMVVSDEGNSYLGYEGTHFYKRNGRYYLFFIHSLRDRWRRVEACFWSDSLEGEFTGGDVLDDDLGYCGQGVAQGGIVDTPDGDWYAVLFQDRGAVGRIPVLVPVSWKNGVPVFGEDPLQCGKRTVPSQVTIASAECDYQYQPLVQSDDFRGAAESAFRDGNSDLTDRFDCFGLKSVWQFNHEPDLTLIDWKREKGMVSVTTDKLCSNLTQAKNMLTQRMCYPGCSGEITVDFSSLNVGDYAGIGALQGCYGMAAVTKRNGAYWLVMKNRLADNSSLAAMPKDSGGGLEQEAVPIPSERGCLRIRLKVEVNFTEMKDEARFYYWNGEDWKAIGPVHRLYFTMDHFTGCRFGLFVYSTEETGGTAGFSEFVYRK